MQVAVVLEEIEVPPGLVGEVVSRAGLAALRTGVEAASLGLDRGCLARPRRRGPGDGVTRRYPGAGP